LTHQIKATASEENDAEEIATCHQLQRQVGKSGVEFTVTLGPETLSVEDITALVPGKLISLSSTVCSPVTLWSGGVAAFEGKLARSGDRLAVSITAPAA
jgi:flagellar motor switch protein FliM